MRATGSCLCGGTTYRVDGPLRDVINCHCVRCRRHTGHFMAASAAATADIDVSGSTLQWHHVDPDDVAYGFCGTCGSTLFWRSGRAPEVTSIAAGTLDQPTGLTTTSALFVDDAGDYHERQRGLTEYGGDN